MKVLRTPDECFQGLHEYPFEPHYADLSASDGGSSVRMHYVDEGPRDGPTVMLCHGNPEWSYSFRRIISRLAAEGFRAIAPDNIGFGRSDKPVDRLQHSIPRHVAWLAELVTELDLRDVTLVCQDWAGTLGLGVVARDPDRFARVLATNAFSPTVEADTAQHLDDRYAVYALNDHQVVVGRDTSIWLATTQCTQGVSPGAIVPFLCTSTLPPEVVAGYDAPFPDEAHMVGLRQFPNLIGLHLKDEGAALNRNTFEALSTFERPFLTVYGDRDRATRGWDRIYQDRIPGAKGRPHAVFAGAGHFLDEDRPEEFADVLLAFARGATG